MGDTTAAGKCARCDSALSAAQMWRQNRYCSRSCARLADWDKRGRSSRGTSGGGYVIVKVDDHPDPTQNGRWVLEHRYVMAKQLSRPLARNERVIHKDEDKTNNKPDNLELWKVRLRDPRGVRAADYHCAGCRCFEAVVVRFS